MQHQDIELLPHCEGYIHLAPPDGGVEGHFLIHNRSRQASTDIGVMPRRALHPLHHQLARAAPEGRIANLAVRVLFDTPKHNIRIRYQAWSDRYEHGPSCLGNGADARRLDTGCGNWSSTPCRGPHWCPAAASGELRCALDVRLMVTVEEAADPLAMWMVQSHSENSYRSMMGSLVYLHALYGGLRHLPLELAIYQVATRASGFEPFDCMQLRLRTGVAVSDLAVVAPASDAYIERMGAAALAAWKVNGAQRTTEGIKISAPMVRGGGCGADPAGLSVFARAVRAARANGSAQGAPP